MTDAYMGEIRPFAFGFAPTGWELCNGKLMSISKNTALFSILGTAYGGDGRTTFALPDLRGAVPMCWGPGPGLSPRIRGESGGTPSVSLTVHEMPAHSHDFNASSALAGERQPVGQVPAQGRGIAAYAKVQADATMANAAITLIGNGAPHNNLMPYQVLFYCISTQGWWPGDPE